MIRKIAQSQGVINLHGQLDEIVRFGRSTQFFEIDRNSTKLQLDRDFPERRSTERDVVVSRGDAISNTSGQTAIASHPPEEDVRVE